MRKIPGSVVAALTPEGGISERLDQRTELGIFRIVQELVSNSLKHANAANITISLSKQGKNVVLQYSDDGIGFDMEKASKGNGLGLQNLESRASMIHGTLDIQSSPGNGFQATLSVNTTADAPH